MITRMQLSRRRGFRLPLNTMSVARPSRWGNPWPVGKPGLDGRVAASAAEAVEWFRVWLLRAALWDNVRADLRGKNLACWCPPGSPCHADVLIEIANR